MNLYGLEPEIFSKLILSVGSHRGIRPLSPIEVADSLRIMVQNGATLEDCARAVHLDGTAMVSRFLRLNQLDEDVKHLIDWGASRTSIGFTSAQELARIHQDDHQHLAKNILEFGLISSEVKQITQIYKRSRRSISECVNEIVGMRPQIEIRHVVVGSIVDEKARDCLAKLSQLERNSLFQKALNQIFPGILEVSGSLSPIRFTMAGDHVFSAAFKKLEGDFEQVVSQKIAELTNEKLH